MIEARDCARLALESRAHFGLGREMLGQHLDRHAPVEPRVARAVHLAHAARTGRCEDLVGTEPGAEGQGHPPTVSQDRVPAHQPSRWQASLPRLRQARAWPRPPSRVL